MKKLIKQEWAIGDKTLIEFTSYLEEDDVTILITKGKEKLSFTSNEAKELKSIMENTNFIFTNENTYKK